MCTIILSEVLLDTPTKDKKTIVKSVEKKKSLEELHREAHCFGTHSLFHAKHTLKAEELQITETAAGADVL